MPHGKRPLAAEYHLQIPDNWAGLPILGPHCGAFHCLHCGDAYAPSTSALKLDDDGSHGWYLNTMSFCPAPRAKNGHKPMSCEKLWERGRGKRWDPRGATPWKLFREARGDDW